MEIECSQLAAVKETDTGKATTTRTGGSIKAAEVLRDTESDTGMFDHEPEVTGSYCCWYLCRMVERVFKRKTVVQRLN